MCRIVRTRTGTALALLVLVTAVVFSATVAYAGTTRVSLGPLTAQGDAGSWNPAVSADGRFVAFYSVATTLVASDTNGFDDVFVRDRKLGTTERVNLGPLGVESNALSGGDWVEPVRPAISANGRYVAFQSFATNLVGGDANGQCDVFVRDRETSTTELVSVDSSGTQGDGYSQYPSISDDGRFVAFYSAATNLVPGDTNGRGDVFVHDRKTGLTVRANVSSAEVEASGGTGYPVIAGKGRYVAFQSDAPNLVAGDTNGVDDVFVRDVLAGTTSRVSVSSTEVQADLGREDPYHPAISADGRYVAFCLDATNLVAGDTNGATDIFVRDRKLGTTRRVSVSSAEAQATGSSYAPAITADGARVAFRSSAANLVAGDTNGRWDIFVRDIARGTTVRASISSTGTEGNGESHAPAFGAGGALIAFTSSASNLVADDTNAARDVFVRAIPWSTYLSIKATSTAPRLGSTVVISGTLRRSTAWGPVIPGERVWLQRLAGRSWTNVTWAKTSNAGAVKFGVKPRVRTIYRLWHGESQDTYAACSSAAVTVAPRSAGLGR